MGFYSSDKIVVGDMEIERQTFTEMLEIDINFRGETPYDGLFALAEDKPGQMDVPTPLRNMYRQGRDLPESRSGCFTWWRDRIWRRRRDTPLRQFALPTVSTRVYLVSTGRAYLYSGRASENLRRRLHSSIRYNYAVHLRAT